MDTDYIIYYFIKTDQILQYVMNTLNHSLTHKYIHYPLHREYILHYQASQCTHNHFIIENTLHNVLLHKQVSHYPSHHKHSTSTPPCTLCSIESNLGPSGIVSWLRVKAAAVTDSGNYSCSAPEAETATVRIQVLDGECGGLAVVAFCVSVVDYYHYLHLNYYCGLTSGILVISLYKNTAQF